MSGERHEERKSLAVRFNVMQCEALLTVGHYISHYRSHHSEQGPWKKSMHQDGEVYTYLEGDDLASFESMTDSKRKSYNREKSLLLKKRLQGRTIFLSEARQDKSISELGELRELIHELTQRMDAVENRITSMYSSFPNDGILGLSPSHDEVPDISQHVS
ncbi:hypothetical protein AC1031_018392 [Aphanomyces cochlioides]|nr:hypothetical protein AC1031_018392 [Aphanomyces cochlioides]